PHAAELHRHPRHPGAGYGLPLADAQPVRRHAVAACGLPVAGYALRPTSVGSPGLAGARLHGLRLAEHRLPRRALRGRHHRWGHLCARRLLRRGLVHPVLGRAAVASCRRGAGYERQIFFMMARASLSGSWCVETRGLTTSTSRFGKILVYRLPGPTMIISALRIASSASGLMVGSGWRKTRLMAVATAPLPSPSPLACGMLDSPIRV